MPLVAEHVSCRYATAAAPVLDGVSISVAPGQVRGLTGPSGTGKSTLGRILTGLQEPDDGAVLLDGAPVVTRRGRMTGEVGLLHQSPRAATNPRLRLAEIITEPLRRRRRPRRDDSPPVADDVALRAVIDRVGLTADLLDRLPGQVSDGQLQRACLARALVARPRFLVCDEPTAMLDAAATAAVAGLLTRLAAEDVGILAISHDHLLLEALCDDVVDLRDLGGRGPAAPGALPEPGGLRWSARGGPRRRPVRR